MKENIDWYSMSFEQAEEELEHCDSYSALPTLLDIANKMLEPEWLTLLGNWWSSCDDITYFLDELLISPLGEDIEFGHLPIIHMMNSEERAMYDNLPDTVTVYRGCYENNMWGLSWTLDRDVAEAFPLYLRYRQQGQPLLVKALAKKKDIAAVKLCRNESEIITYLPQHISTTNILRKLDTTDSHQAKIALDNLIEDYLKNNEIGLMDPLEVDSMTPL